MMILENLIKEENLGDKEYEYYYKLIKSDLHLYWGDEKVQVQSYGIKVTRKDFRGGKLINVESDKITNISPHRYKVHNLIKILYENTVSPIHLIDIIGDYVDEYIADYENILKNAVTICK